MPTFAYVVKDKAGRTHNGVLDIETKNALVERLWKQDFVVLSIEERQDRHAVLKIGQPSVKTEQLVVFSRQLATLGGGGIAIVGALDVLAEQVTDRVFRQVLARVRDDVEGGSSFSEALGKHPRIFSELFINMVKAGESSGRLDEILDRLASYIEKVEGLRRKVAASLFYPAVVSVLAMCITVFLVIFVVPKFKEIFTSFGGQLPGPTQMLLNLSDSLRAYFVMEVILVF